MKTKRNFECILPKSAKQKDNLNFENELTFLNSLWMAGVSPKDFMASRAALGSTRFRREVELHYSILELIKGRGQLNTPGLRPYNGAKTVETVKKLYMRQLFDDLEYKRMINNIASQNTSHVELNVSVQYRH